MGQGWRKEQKFLEAKEMMFFYFFFSFKTWKPLLEDFYSPPGGVDGFWWYDRIERSSNCGEDEAQPLPHLALVRGNHILKIWVATQKTPMQKNHRVLLGFVGFPPNLFDTHLL